MFQLTKRILHTASVVLVLFGTVACSTIPPKTPEQQRADNQTKERVESALNSDPTFYAGGITVRVDHGVVHLGGFVWNDDDLYVVQRITERVPGVTRVVDELELEREHKSR